MTKTTSLHKFNDALGKLAEAAITVTREPVKLTVSDRESVSAARWGRTFYGTKTIDATLVTVKGHSTSIVRSRYTGGTTTVQALFDEQGNYRGGYTPYGHGRSVAEVERGSRAHTSQPFSEVPVSLKDLLTSLERFDPVAIAEAEARIASDEERLKKREEARRKTERQEARERVLAARAEARLALGDEATEAVLDYFLPLF